MALLLTGLSTMVCAQAASAQASGAGRSETLAAQERRVAAVTDRLSVASMALCHVAPAGRHIAAATPGCASPVELLASPRINAWADGARVVVSTGIVEQARTDDELAIVIAHEMAHNILHHGVPGVGATLPDTAAMRANEEEADRFAVRLASAAGYDLAQAPSFLARLFGIAGIGEHAAATHPAGTRRIALLSAAIARTRWSIVARSDQFRSSVRISGNTSWIARLSGRI